MTNELESRLRELEGWARELDGRINAKLDQLETHDERCNVELRELRNRIDNKFGIVFKKLTALEIKVAIFSASSAAVGSFLAKYLFP